MPPLATFLGRLTTAVMGAPFTSPILQRIPTSAPSRLSLDAAL
jgi:hypothetical protein